MPDSQADREVESWTIYICRRCGWRMASKPPDGCEICGHPREWNQEVEVVPLERLRQAEQERDEARAEAKEWENEHRAHLAVCDTQGYEEAKAVAARLEAAQTDLREYVAENLSDSQRRTALLNEACDQRDKARSQAHRYREALRLGDEYRRAALAGGMSVDTYRKRYEEARRAALSSEGEES